MFECRCHQDKLTLITDIWFINIAIVLVRFFKSFLCVLSHTQDDIRADRYFVLYMYSWRLGGIQKLNRSKQVYLLTVANNSVNCDVICFFFLPILLLKFNQYNFFELLISETLHLFYLRNNMGLTAPASAFIKQYEF